MAKYTLELRTIEESPNMKVFDFNYDFYVDDLEIKKKFEQKFIDHYYFDEIGYETIMRFKHRLKMKLNEIMPYYSQLYQTELASKDINFLLNKDLKETTIRDLNKTDNSTSQQNGESNENNNTNGTDNTTYKESSLNDGNATLSLDDLTTINDNKNSYGNTTTTNNTSNNRTIGNTEGKEKEEITLISQGNIGITSSAELLQKWRDVIINIDAMIIKDCRDLFMKIF